MDNWTIQSEGIETQLALAAPHSREAEESTIGAVFINPDAYYDIVQILDASDFYIHRNRFIWEAFDALNEKHTPLDLLTITDELERKGRLADVTPSYLTALVNQVPDSLNAESYARIVTSHALRRKMIAAANRVAGLAYDEKNEADAALADAHAELDAITPTYRTHTSPLGDRVFANAFDASLLGDTPGVPTGLIGLDRMLGGYMDGDLIYVAARPGEGKSGYLMTAMRAALQAHKRPALFSMEMGDVSVGQRLIGQQFDLDTYKIRRGKLDPAGWESLRQGSEWLNELETEKRLHINEKPAVNTAYIHAVCKRLKSRGLLDIIFVDYVQLMNARGENRHQQISTISRALKEIALDLNVPVVSAAQLKRDAESRRPKLSEMKESGSLEQDCDVAIFIWREDEAIQNTEIDLSVKMSVAKHRNGPVGDLMKNGNSLVQFRKSCTRFENAIAE